MAGHSASEAVVESIDGIIVVDEYRWLEEESQSALAWQKAQNESAETRLRNGPWFDRVRIELEPYLEAMQLAAPIAADRFWFRANRNADRAQLIRSETVTGQGESFRPGLKETEDFEAPTFDWFQPSPNGRYVAYGAPEGGGLQGGAQLLRLRILDTETKRDLETRIPHVAAGLAWLANSSGFYFVRGLEPASKCPERRVAFYLIGAETLREEPLRGLGFASLLQISKDGRYLSVVTGTREPRADWILDRKKGSWQPFLINVPATCFGYFAGDHYIALTTWKSPRGRIVKIPITSPSRMESWTEIIPESADVKRNLVAIGHYILIGELRQSSVHLTLFNQSGQLVSEIPMPGPGSVSTHAKSGWFQQLTDSMVSPGEDGFCFVHSDYARAPSLYWFNMPTRTLEQLSDQKGVQSGTNTQTRSLGASDGELIPIELVYREDCRLPAPTIIYCYGAYNFAMVRSWISVLGPFVDAGGLAVFAHIRGGGEFGTEWWRAGHHEHKQQSFNDIYSVAEGLIKAGLSTTDRLAVLGISNGGLNVCTAITQRPELFRAGVALAPQCDLVRYSKDPFCGGAPIEGYHQGFHVNGGTWRDPAWGRGHAKSVRLKAHFSQSMYPDPFQYSPYHLVSDGVAYPALILVCGSEDVWCPPWHSRKFAARLQAATTSSRPILLRVWQGGGHDHPLHECDQVSEWLSFVMHELDMNIQADFAVSLD